MYYRWYVSLETDSIENRLKPLPKKAIKVSYSEKSDKERITFDYPYKVRQGLHFAVLRFDVQKDAGFSFGFIMGPAILKASHQFDKNTTGTVTAYFPMTPLDYLRFYMNKKKDTKIVNLRYGVLTEKEFKRLMESPSTIELKNDIIRQLKTERRFNRTDELFNLDTDYKMETNLLKNGDHTAKKVKEKKSIYNYLKFYWAEKTKHLGESVRSKPLTKMEKDMLKSLGYL